MATMTRIFDNPRQAQAALSGLLGKGTLKIEISLTLIPEKQQEKLRSLAETEQDDTTGLQSPDFNGWCTLNIRV